MPTGFGYLESNREFRLHWVKRTIATLIDMLVVFTPITMVMFIMQPPNIELVAGLVTGFALFMYCGLFEWYFGQTLGKRLMHLRVITLDHYMSPKQTFIRSIAKMFWFFFLFIDVIIGLAIVGDDPRQRFSDTVAKTSVIAYEPVLGSIKKRAEPSKQYQLSVEERKAILAEAENK